MSQRPITDNIESLEQGNQSGLTPGSVAPKERVTPLVPNLRQLFEFPSGKRRGGLLNLERGRTSPPGTASADGLDPFTMLVRRQSARIAIKSGGKFLFVFMADIAAIEAKGNYILLHHSSSSHFLRESISMMEHRFSPYGFVRIHRSALVNAALVEEIQPCSTGEYVLRVRGGREYSVTRTYKQNLHHLAACWLGSDGFYSDRRSVTPDVSARAAFNV